MHDRLALLAACHGHLIYHAIPSLDAYRASPSQQLSRLLPRYRATIYQLVRQADPDVLAALWPAGGVTWMVAGINGQPTARLLSAKRGPLGEAGGELLRLDYDLTDPDGERRAWRALKAVLR